MVRSYVWYERLWPYYKLDIMVNYVCYTGL
jgi:hypothetical protein